MDEIKDIAKYRKLYLRGVITKQELSKECEKIVFATSDRVEYYMAGITDSIYSVAYNTPSELDEHTKKMISQLYIMWKLGLIGYYDHVTTTEYIETLVKDIQSDYNNWREQHKKYEI